MKRLSLLAAAAALGISASVAQTQPSKEQQQVASTLKEIQAQQAKIAANQAEIDKKIGALAEAIRLARIYAGRGGH